MLASNQQNPSEADDFPSIDELLFPTKQNRVITVMDLTSEHPPRGDYKQTLETDLTSPNSPRPGASQGGYSCFCSDSNMVSYQAQETPWSSISSTI